MAASQNPIAERARNFSKVYQVPVSTTPQLDSRNKTIAIIAESDRKPKQVPKLYDTAHQKFMIASIQKTSLDIQTELIDRHQAKLRNNEGQPIDCRNCRRDKIPLADGSTNRCMFCIRVDELN